MLVLLMKSLHFIAILDRVPPGGQQVVNALEATGAHNSDVVTYQRWMNGNYRDDLQRQIIALRTQAQEFRDVAAQITANENTLS